MKGNEERDSLGYPIIRIDDNIQLMRQQAIRTTSPQKMLRKMTVKKN